MIVHMWQVHLKVRSAKQKRKDHFDVISVYRRIVFIELLLFWNIKMQFRTGITGAHLTIWK